MQVCQWLSHAHCRYIPGISAEGNTMPVSHALSFLADGVRCAAPVFRLRQEREKLAPVARQGRAPCRQWISLQRVLFRLHLRASLLEGYGRPQGR